MVRAAGHDDTRWRWWQEVLPRLEIERFVVGAAGHKTNETKPTRLEMGRVVGAAVRFGAGRLGAGGGRAVGASGCAGA